MKKLSKKIILQNYFDEIKSTGSGVPRDKNMDGVPGRVGHHYIFVGKESGEEIEVRCRRNAPYYYTLVNNQ